MSGGYRPRRAAGFTLIELLVVLLILGMIAGLAGPQVMKYLGESKTKTAKLQIEELSTSLDLFKLDAGRYPDTQEGLQALVQALARTLSHARPGRFAKTNEKVNAITRRLSGDQT